MSSTSGKNSSSFVCALVICSQLKPAKRRVSEYVCFKEKKKRRMALVFLSCVKLLHILVGAFLAFATFPTGS